MQIKEFLNTVCEQIKYKPIRNSISEELENHIEESKENYIQEGLEEQEAEEKAIIQMGDAEKIGKKLNKIHKPKLDWRLLIILIILLGFGFLVAFTRISPSIVFSPVIIAMPLYIIAFVGFVNNEKQEKKKKAILNKNINLHLIKIIILSIISMLLLTMIPSLTSAFILGLIYLIIGTVKLVKTKQNRKRNILMLWGIPLIIGIILLIHIIGIAPYRWDRFVAVYNPESEADSYGWLSLNRKLIINSAQAFGEAEDTSTALDLFDEGTNYAFISILAHYGWVVYVYIAKYI